MSRTYRKIPKGKNVRRMRCLPALRDYAACHADREFMEPLKGYNPEGDIYRWPGVIQSAAYENDFHKQKLGKKRTRSYLT